MSTTLNANVAAPHSEGVVLRLAHAADESRLNVLAQLDEQPDLSGAALIAWVGGEPVAAMSLEDGRVIADPFVATRDVVSLLKLRARQLVAPRTAGFRRRTRH